MTSSVTLSHVPTSPGTTLLGLAERNSRNLARCLQRRAPFWNSFAHGLRPWALQRLPIPQPFMAQALSRFRCDLVKDEPFNHARMGLIKAYFVRLKPGGDLTMTISYNLDHPSPAYHCGGLLAVLANLQRAALGDVGAGVVQRFYAATSQSPGLILGRLVSNARNHLAKLEAGLAWWYEERIAELMTKVGDAAPRILDLEGQRVFALGYYQKLAELRAGKKTSPESRPEKGATT